MYDLNQREKIVVTRSEADLDRAASQAYKSALSIFGVDEYGHFTNVENAHRSSCVLIVRFLSYDIEGTMVGINHCYVFEAYVTKG